MKEGEQRSTEDMQVTKNNLYSYLISFEPTRVLPETEVYRDFCRLPLEQRGVVFQEMSLREQLEAVLYGAESKLGRYALVKPFFSGALHEEEERKYVGDMEELSELMHVLRRVLLQKGAIDSTKEKNE